MDETEEELSDERKTTTEETDEEAHSKPRGRSVHSGDSGQKYQKEMKPHASSTSSSECPDHYRRNECWDNFDAYEGQEGLWTTGEYEIRDFERGKKPCKSETSDSPSTETQEKSNESAISSEALSNVYSKLSPFNIRWSFGINCNVRIINLTTEDSFEVFYVSGHFGVLYNYGADTMTFLPGHNFPISSISADTTGRWLVTADEGEDTVIIIWDRKKKLPVWSLYNVFPKQGVTSVSISQDARFLAAVNCHSNHVVKFWLWTYGNDEPDGVVNIDPASGKAKNIDFNHLNTRQFVVTMEFSVTFCEWNEKAKILNHYAPTFETRSKKLGTMRESIFLDDNHTVLSSTSQGFVVFWTDVTYTEMTRPEIPGTIERKFLKCLRLHKSGITSLRLCDGIIATGSEDGNIFFHDQQCRLLYWMPKLKLDPIASISFNVEHVRCSADPFGPDVSSESIGNEQVQNVLDYDVSLDKQASDISEFTEETTPRVDDEYSALFPLPADCTLEAKPFFIRDFLFLNVFGRIGYMSHRREKIKYYLYEMEAPILSMDCNPNKPHLVMGNALGRLILYDHNLKKKLLSVSFPSAVTTLKYSCFGHNLVIGCQNGDLLMLDSLLLSVKLKLETSKASIEKLCFSPGDDILAFYDTLSTVHVYKKKPPNEKWNSMGKYVSHYKPIVDMIFDKHPDNPKLCRLFTIGQDRTLVEYDIKNLEENKLKLLTTMRIEQTAIPLCFLSVDKFYGQPHFVISNDHYKLKVVETNTFTCVKTTLGPTADTPIRFMKLIKEQESHPDRAKMVYTTDKHIGIRILPPTGNPFEGMGMIAHTEKITAIAVSHNDKYVFTVGANDPNPLMWEVNPTSVDVACTLGGIELQPFASLIEGGTNSFLFQELEDFFYYAQIIHQGEDPNLDRSVSKNLALCEIPDLFRALGYYPSDYEVNNLLHELKYMDYSATGQIRKEITFEECVKAFLNHRPVEGTTLADINRALLAIADLSDPTDIIIERSELYKALEERAECMEHAEVLGYLCILLLPKDENNPVPHNLCLNEFAEQVLGIDLTVTEENVRQITHAFENK